MARLIGPDEACRTVFLTSGVNTGKAVAQGMSAPIYLDLALTTLADILSTTDGAVAGSTLTVDAYSKIPLFKYPDSVDTVYTSVNGGPAVPLYARTDDRLDGLAVRVAAVESGGGGGGDDTLVVHKAGAEAITGVKTFSVEPIVPTPTAGTSPATKAYTDTGDAAGIQRANHTGAQATSTVTGLDAALAAKVAKGDLVIDPRDAAYGSADPTGVADATAAVLAAFTAANALARTGVAGTILHPGATVLLQGKFNLATIASAIPIRCNVLSAGAEFKIPAAYAGTCVLVGHATSGSILQDADISLPDIIKPTGTAIVAGSVGTVVQNLWNSRLKHGRTAYFENAIHYTGLGNGTVYNNIDIGWVSYSKVSLKLKPGAGGWANQNVFVGGGIQQSAGFSGGTRLTGYRHLELDGAGINSVDGNNFYGVSFEGDVSDNTFYVHHASHNTWTGCRFEAGTAFTPVSVSGSSLTATAHGLVVGDMIIPTYSGSLPTGMAAVTPYYVVSVADANTFSISRDKAGAAITFGSSGSSVIYARPHRVYFDTSGVGVSNNIIRDPVNPLEWLDIVHSSGVASGNVMTTPRYRNTDTYGPEDLPFYRARNTASSLALTRPYFGTYAPTVNPHESPDSWSTALSDRGLLWKSGVYVSSGSGSPESVVAAPVGSLYLRSNGAAGATLYIKESGSGNTGWAAPAAGSTPRVTSVTSSATPAPSATTDDVYLLTALAANATFAAPSGSPASAQKMTIRIKDNGTARTLTWNAVYRAVGVTLPTTTVISKTLYLGMIYNSAETKWDVLGVAQEA